MRTRMTSVCDRLIDFVTGIVNWLLDTFALVFDIILEFLARAIELVIAILQLSFQVVCFLRDVCIEAMQTFVNVFRGIVNVVSSIKCEDVEDFAAACMVVLLWIGAVKIGLGVLAKRSRPAFSNPFKLLTTPGNDCSPSHPPPVRDRTPNPVKGSMRRKVNQPRRGVGGKRPMSSSISSSSSVSNDR